MNEEFLVMIINGNSKLLGKVKERSIMPDGQVRYNDVYNVHEVLNIVDHLGRPGIILNHIGDIFHIPEGCLVIEVSSKSKYYEAYYTNTSGISITSPSQ